MSDAANGWVHDVRLSENEMCALFSWIYFVTRDYCILDIFSNPPVKYDKAEGRF
jgi:hypothetical protein